MPPSWLRIAVVTWPLAAASACSPARTDHKLAEDPARSCASSEPSCPSTIAAPGPPAPSSAAPADPMPQVPAKLAETARQFGMTMTPGWQWTELDRHIVRFDWSGRPPGGGYEVRWSFWMKGNDTKNVARFLPQSIYAAAMNLAEGPPCEIFEQPPEFARLAGADRAMTVCFTPAKFVTHEAGHGVMHGLLRGDALVVAVVLADTMVGVVPLPEQIGGRFTGVPPD